MTLPRHAPSVLCLTALLAFLACGPGGTISPPAALNGFWLSRDGGPGVVLFEAQGEQLWDAEKVFLPRVKIGWDDLVCSAFQRSSTGLVIRTDSTFFRTAAKQVDGGTGLQLVFRPRDLDSAYRAFNDAGNAVGTVTGQFSGLIAVDSAQLATVSYRVEYRDSEKLLAFDEGSFIAPKVDQCK